MGDWYRAGSIELSGSGSMISATSLLSMLFDEYVADHSARMKPVRLRNAFCQTSDDAMCSIIVDSKSLYLGDDHANEHGADLIVEEIMKALQ